jgi:hypothetical protein
LRCNPLLCFQLAQPLLRDYMGMPSGSPGAVVAEQAQLSRDWAQAGESGAGAVNVVGAVGLEGFTGAVGL